MGEPEIKEKGLVRGIVEVFSDKMKELEPVQAAIVFVALAIIFTFGVVGFTSAITTGIVKMIQIIPQVVGATAI